MKSMSAPLHQFTPSLTAIDPRGLTVRNVAYHRLKASQSPQMRVTRQVFGATGLLLEQWDPRLREVPNQQQRHSLSGQVLRSQSTDAGWRVLWLGGAGQPLDAWDGRGTHRQHRYDHLLRPEAVFERAADEPRPRCVERLDYADASSQAATRNGCGRLIRHDDPAGSLFYAQWDISGQLLNQARRFHVDGPVDWPQPDDERNQRLEAQRFTTRARFNALGEQVEHLDAKGNRVHYAYDIDGQAASVALTLQGGPRKMLVDQRTYNASGQVHTERAGNGVVSRTHYSEADGRIRRVTASRAQRADALLQDLAYEYDRVGNVLGITDSAQPTRWNNNARIDPIQAYRYDTLYQLIEASGWESVQGTGNRVFFGSRDDSLMRRYVRHYTYDPSGNLSQWRHVPSSGSGFTRTLTVAPHSNHALPEVDFSPGLGKGFDLNGNLQALGRGRTLDWDARNQLTRVTHFVRDEHLDDEERYVYDSSGYRILKRRRSQAHGIAHTDEVRYLPGLELRRNSATGEWLNVVSSDAVRVLQWERHPSGTVPPPQARFSLCDHVASSTLELDENAQLLSQESYYPYGATAWWAAKNAIEASYKVIRYSGKERDASGLYYYGFRYYAPWLMRWINPDPAGIGGGMNLYAMVGGNPVSLVDEQGLVPARRRTTSIGTRPSSPPLTEPVSAGITPRNRFQAAGSAALRDYLAVEISNYIGVLVDQTFAATTPTRALNNVLRGVVAILDALAVGHMSLGVAGRWTNAAFAVAFPAAFIAAVGFAVHSSDDSSSPETEWDPVARARFAGHVRAFSREAIQQVISGVGSGASWGETRLRQRFARTAAAATAYSMATVANSLYGATIPGPLQPNVGPYIEAYDAFMGTGIRSGHATAVHDTPRSAPFQLPDIWATWHGGITRAFNQVWGFWSGAAIEAIATVATGSTAQRQSVTTRRLVAAGRGLASGLTEFRGLLMVAARQGYGRLRSVQRQAPTA
jgi:insecticidal toxin complex protein TccC